MTQAGMWFHEAGDMHRLVGIVDSGSDAPCPSNLILSAGAVQSTKWGWVSVDLGVLAKLGNVVSRAAGAMHIWANPSTTVSRIDIGHVQI